MTQILILYATTHGHTRVVAQAIADRLRDDEVRVRMVDFGGDHYLPDLAGFHAVVLGSRVHFGKLDRRLHAFVIHHRLALASMPVFLFSVGMAASGPHATKPDPALARWSEQLQLKTRATAAFAGALLYRSYNPVMRLFMRILSARGGHPTDTSRDYVFTDWDKVKTFADDIVHVMGRAGDASEVA